MEVLFFCKMRNPQRIRKNDLGFLAYALNCFLNNVPMNRIAYTLFFALSLGLFAGCGSSAPEGSDIKLTTSEGVIYIDLFDETPQHRDNFIKLAKEGFYEKNLFHRVMRDFMIQGGDPLTKDESKKAQWGTGGPGYTIPQEIQAGLYHKRGALAAARMPDQMNPNWESSGSQFYIVHGKKFTEQELSGLNDQINYLLDERARASFDAKPDFAWYRKLDMEALRERNPDSAATVKKQIDEAYAAHRKDHPRLEWPEDVYKGYMEEGGTAMLDGMYTVFGQVVQGMDIVDKIAAVQVEAPNRPVEPVTIESVEVIE